MNKVLIAAIAGLAAVGVVCYTVTGGPGRRSPSAPRETEEAELRESRQLRQSTSAPDDCAAEGFASAGTTRCVTALREGKVVLVCIQDAATEGKDVVLKAAEDFRADGRFADATEIVRIDPADRSESQFIRDLGVDPTPAEAVIVILVPPGTVGVIFKGAVTKETLVAAVTGGLSHGCGCGSGGTWGKWK